MSYEFTVILAGSPAVEAIADAVYEAGCDDTLLHSRAGTTYLEFDREAPSLADAVASAVRDVMKAGLAVAKIEMAAEPQPA